MAASPAAASEATTSERLAGLDRYATAVDISQEVFDASDDVVLARGDVYADALAGNGVAGAVDAPILLTQSNALDARTAAEIERLGADTVYIMGGTEAISQDVEDALAADHTVVRIEGVTRIETAVDAAEFIGDSTNGIGETNTDQTTAILVNGYNFPDAVSASPAAYNQEIPVLLTTSDDLSDATAAALEAEGIERVLIVGGTDAVSAAVETEVATLVDDVERFAGLNRYSTATDFATDFLMAELGWDGPEFDLATGEKFADALTGGPHAGTIEAPILLTQTATLSEATEDFLTTNCEAFDVQFVLGGTAAVSDATEAAAQAAAQCDAPTTNQAFSADQQQVARQLGGTPGAGTGGVIEYEFSGLDPARDYDVALVQCGDDSENEDILFNGDFVSFADQDLNDQADGLGATQEGNAVIATVGFTSYGTQSADDVSPNADGTLLVRLDSQDVDCAYVVVFDDNADDDILNLDPATTNSYNMPVDAFGVAGPALWHFGEAATGSDIDGEVVFVDKDANFFVLDDGYQYLYSAEDSGYYDGSEVDYALTFAQFEQYLSIGDYLYDFSNIDSGAYSRTNPNVFQFEEDTPNQPAGVTLSTVNADAGATANDILATVAPAGELEGDVDQYCVELYSVAANGTLTLVTDDCTDEVNTVGTGDADNTVVFTNQADGNYVARAYADSETDDGSYWSVLSAPLVLDSIPNDTTAPTISDLRVTSDLSSPGIVSDTDVIRFQFSESMDPMLDDGGVFRFTDATGETYQITCIGAAADGAAEGEANCALSDRDLNADTDVADAGETNNTLTVTLIDDPVKISGAGDGIAQLDGTVTQLSAQFQDLSGNDVDLAGSADKVIDNEL